MRSEDGVEAPTSASPADPMSTTAVARRFCADARQGRVASGSQVRMRDLMSWYGASRTAAQGALGTLRRQGLLVTDLRGRLVLRVPTRSEVREILALRTALETLALELAVDGLDDAGLERMCAAMIGLRRAIVDRRWEVDRSVSAAFNSLARAIRSPMLLRMIAGLHYDSRGYRALLEDLMESSAIREGDHLEALGDALIARDAAAACRIHRTHIEQRGEWALQRLPQGT